MMDRLEMMEEMNNERFGAGTSRRRAEIAEGKWIMETSGDEEPRRKDPYGVRSAVVEKSTPEWDIWEERQRGRSPDSSYDSHRGIRKKDKIHRQTGGRFQGAWSGMPKMIGVKEDSKNDAVTQKKI